MIYSLVYEFLNVAQCVAVMLEDLCVKFDMDPSTKSWEHIFCEITSLQAAISGQGMEWREPGTI